MKEVAVAALSQTESVPRSHVVVSDASVPCCFDRGIGVLVGDNLEFVAKRNTAHPEFEGWFVMPFPNSRLNFPRYRSSQPYPPCLTRQLLRPETLLLPPWSPL